MRERLQQLIFLKVIRYNEVREKVSLFSVDNFFLLQSASSVFCFFAEKVVSALASASARLLAFIRFAWFWTFHANLVLLGSLRLLFYVSLSSIFVYSRPELSLFPMLSV